MFEGNICRSVENRSDPCVLKEGKQFKGFKKRSKALSDVKNTIHSHSSVQVEKSGQKAKHGKSSVLLQNSKNVAIAEEEIENFEYHNHASCECANSLHETAFCDEYTLSKKEIGYLANRMNFFYISPVPNKTFKHQSLEDLEVIDMRRPWLDEKTEDDVMAFNIPEPSFF